MAENAADEDTEIDPQRTLFLAALIHEIDLLRALLNSIDESSEPDEKLRRQYATKLKELEKELDQVQTSISQPKMSLPAHLQGESRRIGHEKVGSSIASNQSQDGYTSSSETQPVTQWGSGVEISSSEYAAAPSTPSLSLPSRKRQLSCEQGQSCNKARRPIASPSFAESSPQHSTLANDDILGALLGSDYVQDLHEYEKEQAQWDLRQQQERKDAELARSLQDSWDDDSFSFDAQLRPSLQTSLSMNGNKWSGASPPSSGIARELKSATLPKQPHVNSEPWSTPYAGWQDEGFGYAEAKAGHNGSFFPDSLANKMPPEPIPQHIKLEPNSFEAYPSQKNLWNAGAKTEPSSVPMGDNLSFNDSGCTEIPQYGGWSVYSDQKPFMGGNETTKSHFDVPGSSGNSFQPYLGLDPLDLRGNTHSLPHDRRDVQPHSFYSASYNDPGKSQEELKSLLKTIRPDEDTGSRAREETPVAMKIALMEHQKLGLTWMKAMEQSTNKGGILADDMGLGKTVQMLALMVSTKSQDPACKTTLIVAPVALMGQWAREISRLLKIGQHSLSVEILHGNTRDQSWSRLREKDVVLTTYGTLTSEIKRKHAWEEKLKHCPSARPTPSEMLPLLSDRSKWYRVVLDEAQWIKNKAAKASTAAGQLQATYRWCLTGTPMQNTIDELYSLIRFLRITPYNSWEAFNRDFARPLKAKISWRNEKDTTMQQLQALCKAIMLRRTKYSKIDGQPILQLPEKILQHQDATFSKDEQEFYLALEGRAQFTFNKYVAAGTVGRNYSNALVLLLRLRQACCHPHLIKDLQMETGAGPGVQDKFANAKLLPTDVIDRVRQIEAFECPICFDAAINSLIFNPCGHPSCNECFDRISTQANANAEHEFGAVINCPTCRTKIDSAKMTDLASVKRLFSSDSVKAQKDDLESIMPSLAADDSDGDESTEEEDEEDDDDDFIDDSELLSNTTQSASKSEGPRTPDHQLALPSIVSNGTSLDPDAPHSSRKAKRNARSKGKAKADTKTYKSLAQLRKEGLRNKAAKKKYLRRLEKKFQTSAKIDKAIEVLDSIEGRGTREKTIIFSQFTSLLDLVEVPLARKGIQYKRYDGSMNRAEREEAVVAFTDDPRYTVLLVSLKAGNSGLNLTAASQVIIFDPHWNW